VADNDLLQAALEESEVEYIPLKVSSGILLHIGAGIYNSVAGAIKELVSNAYDADATRITISTNYPDFDKITVVDNGSGMTEATFAKAMSTIGSSLKREMTPQGLTPTYKRPIIGHLGIGLMALSQVCDVAFIESQAAGAETRFVAKLDFSAIRNRSREQMLASTLELLQSRQQEAKLTSGGKSEIQRVQDILETLTAASVAKDAEYIAKRKKQKRLQGEHLGYCLIYPRLSAVPGGQGTKITLYPLDPAVVATFQDRNRDLDALPKRLLPDEYQSSLATQETKTKKTRNIEEEERLWQERRERINAYDWRELCELLRQGRLAYQVLPQYHQFLWELATMSPVRYFSDGPVTLKSVLQDEYKQLEEFKFSVTVDNRELFKPVLLPSANIARIEPSDLREELDYFIDTFKHTIQVGEGRNKVELRFRGYLFWQRSQIQPSTIRGIKIYIRNVGIGLYDHTLMNFSAVNPTSRAGQLSGEIYVESGLENALNVDRNSFRETDAEYVALRDYIWKRLGSAARTDGVLGRSVDSYWERKKIKEKEEERKHLTKLRELVDSVTDSKVEIELSHTKGDKRFVEEGKHKLIVHLNSTDWPRSAVERRRAQRIMIPFKAAVMAGFSPEELLNLLDEQLL
jgi:hypothetical protein